MVIYMTKLLKIAASPLTGNIYAGTTVKGGKMWGKNKQDVTIDALVAVSDHVIRFGAPVVISSADGTPEYKITVEKLNKDK